MREESVGKRHSVRTNVQLRAQMRFGAERQPVDCAIMDISLSGARIVLPDDGDYPEDFEVFIPARSEMKWAVVRWREKRQIGVEFLKGRRDGQGAATPSVLARLESLESQPMAAAFQPVANLETRLSAIEARLFGAGAPPPLDGPSFEGAMGAGPWFEALLDRLAHMEARCGALERASAPQSASAANGEGSPSPAVATPAGFDEASAARLADLETTVAELRSSLRALILLMSAQLRRASA